jgi:nucleoside-diphosphate-sugar epimerase
MIANDENSGMISCAVTGGRGFLGSHIVRRLQRSGHRVLMMGRDPNRDNIRFCLGEEIEPRDLRGIQALVHCAYDRDTRDRAEEWRINVLGSERLLRAAHVAGIRKIVFVSTVSAFEGCRSFYGQGKLVVEHATQELGGIVVRPGLVYGEPGMGIFGALSKLTVLPLLPVPDGGHQPFVLAHVADVAEAATGSLGWDPVVASGPVVLAHAEPIEFIEILRTVATKRGKRLRTIPVPGWTGIALLRAVESVGVKLGFRSDSLIGLLYPNQHLDFSLTRKLGLEFRKFADVLSTEL